MTRHRFVVLLLSVVLLGAVLAPGASAQSGESTIAWHVTIAPSWFDPNSAPAQITPFGILYAFHDSVVRATYGQRIGPGLAEAWSESPDGLVYEFRLRRNLKFHNGDPLTAEDVKFSYDRYKGAGAKVLQQHVEAVEVVNPLTVKFRLKAPWPDFMTFYGTTVTGAGFVVPKKYITQVGDEGFRKHPIGAGPFKFVSHKPGVEVVIEANPEYWRKVSNVKRFVMKSVPEGTTRVAMLKNGEADIVYALDGEDALNVKRDTRLQLVPSKHASIFWIEFADQWDPKSPWHDKRVRQAAILALDRKQISEVSCLGFCPPTSTIIPRVMDFALQTQAAPHDPDRAKKLLAEAGYPNGLDAGDFVPIPPFLTTAELSVNFLAAVGIRVKIKTTERAAFLTNWREKKLRGLFMTAVGNSGNAASRVAEFYYSKGTYAYGGYPDIDELFLQQGKERDVAKREALLHRIQNLAIERAMFLPIMDYRTLRGVGPRVAEHALDAMPLNPFPAYEDIKLKP
jgi:peptide/nickel transport system substrate-binding protein